MLKAVVILQTKNVSFVCHESATTLLWYHVDMKFGIRKLVGLTDGEEIMTLAFVVLTQYRRVTDRRMDGHVAIAITRASMASRG